MVQTSARSPKLFAGQRVRRLREGAGLNQAALARTIRLSPSYLNQIERDQRPIAARVLQRLCETFRVGVDHFGDGEDLRLVHDLREALADPVFGAAMTSVDDIRHAVQAMPELAKRILVLHRAYRMQSERLQEQDLHRPGSASIAPYEEVRDWVQSRHNHFALLDRTAEEVFEQAPLASAQLREGLIRRLADMHRVAVSSDPSMLMGGTFWRLDRSAKRLFLAESNAPESQVFWLAHVLGQLEQKDVIEREVRSARFSTPEACSLARVGLGNYFAGALLLPYRRFLQAAQATRYDIEQLQARFGASFEQVCHRLSTMQRPGLQGLPFYFAKTDIAGNILKRSSATRFRFSRLGGPCPLWNVYRTFANPGQILVQLARTPDEVTYLNIARTVSRSGGYHLARPRAVAVVLGCEIEHAAQTVYAAGLDLRNADAAIPIGPGCRICERTTCRHRAVPPLGGELDIGTEERGVVPYRIKSGALEVKSAEGGRWPSGGSH